MQPVAVQARKHRHAAADELAGRRFIQSLEHFRSAASESERRAVKVPVNEVLGIFDAAIPRLHAVEMNGGGTAVWARAALDLGEELRAAIAHVEDRGVTRERLAELESDRLLLAVSCAEALRLKIHGAGGEQSLGPVPGAWLLTEYEGEVAAAGAARMRVAESILAGAGTSKNEIRALGANSRAAVDVVSGARDRSTARRILRRRTMELQRVGLRLRAARLSTTIGVSRCRRPRERRQRVSVHRRRAGRAGRGDPDPPAAPIDRPAAADRRACGRIARRPR